MLNGFSALTELAGEIRRSVPTAAGDWSAVDQRFQEWVRQPGLRDELKSYLKRLDPERAAAVVARSRETTTHFAWCLFDDRNDPFSIWLHEYKPQRDWRHGYADSVHNHRYHFCTTILSGSYLHERFTVELDRSGTLVRSTSLLRSTLCHAGAGGFLLAHEFHRIPRAEDGTMTLLVKSRSVNAWSLSYDPDTRTSHRHVPVENRFADLVDKL